MTAARATVIVAAPVIAAVAAHAAANTPGVVRLEPGVRGLLDTVVRTGRQRWTGTEPAPAGGIRIRQTGAGLVVSADITIAAGRPAAEIGCAVQRRITEAVREHTGQQVDRVCVCIIDIAGPAGAWL
ncbi:MULTISPECIES: Asp23/Gls24 family envelope stress response protein [Nocardia]|nr:MULTISPECIES: Asp23/Gls24 family envelope stress response protein [Nocardia]MBF6351603.1 Asp23/Gls24 family envelope stress response protein [Nocardia flavorosea]